MVSFPSRRHESKTSSRIPSKVELAEEARSTRRVESDVSSPGNSFGIHSPPLRERLPKTQNGLVAASIASLATDVSDDVLQRLAKMVAAEIKAETRKTRVLLRDVGSQTIKEISLAPRGDAAELPLVNSSTQTLSTGGIKSDNLFVDND